VTRDDSSTNELINRHKPISRWNNLKTPLVVDIEKGTQEIVELILAVLEPMAK